MFKGVGFALIIRQLGLLSKQAINMASDLEEVQNVVDVSFGSMADQVEAFANTAVRSYGMSALTAKRMASTFMAMSNGMDIAQEAGKNMSLQLTALAGDMASFYNVGQDIAQTALNSIFTGETESLKKFGIVLTETNLEAFALSQGIKKSYQSMSQAEKVALRYNYVLNATKNAQGDFARTSGSWANQIRLLKEQWSQFLGILGKGLIQILTPVVKALNQMLASLISIGNAITKVFGGKTTNNMSTTIKDSAIQAGDLDAGLGDANESAKKLSRTIAGFDELNVLNPKEEEKKPDSGNTGSDIGAGNIADFKVDETQTEGVKTRLEQFVKDCQEILNKWQSTIPKLEINFDTEKALSNLQNIGKNLLDTIAGWGSFIITIGIDIANDLDIGRLGNDVLGLVEAFTELASSITKAVVPALENFYNVGLSPLVQAIGEVADSMITWATGIIKGWSDWFTTNKDNIAQFGTTLGEIVEPISKIIGNLLKITWDVLANALTIINDALQGIATSLINMKPETLKSIITDLLLIAGGTLTAKAFLNIQDGLMGFVTGTDQAGNAWKGLKQIIKEGNSEGDLGYFITEPFKQAFEKIDIVFFTPFKTALNTHLFTPFKSILDAMRVEWTASMTAIGSSGGGLQILESTVKSVGAGFSQLWAIISAHPFALVAVAIATVVALLVHLWNTNEEFRQSIQDLWNNTLKPTIDKIVDVLKELWNEHLKPLIDRIKELWENTLKPSLTDLWDTVKDIWDKLSVVLGEIIKVVGVVISTVLGVLVGGVEMIASIIGGIADVLTGIIDFLTGVFTGDWEKAWTGIKEIVLGILDAISGVFEGFIDGLIEGITNLGNAINDLFGKDNKKKNTYTLNTNSKINLKNQAKNINIPQMKAFANGGVLHSPTVGLMGEYSGASNNPEIVTPQSLMKETMEDANASLINAIFAIGNQISKSVDDKNMDVYMDTAKVTRRITKEQTAQKKQMGTSLVMV